MNARNQVFNFVLDGRLIFDVVSSLFNTIVFNRSYGKFVYNSEKSFSVSNIGYMDVDCNFLDFTYIACSSKSLHNHIRAEVETFCDLFRNDDTRNLGEISLEFYQVSFYNHLFVSVLGDKNIIFKGLIEILKF